MIIIGCRKVGRGREDGMWGLGDVGTQGQGDAFLKYRISEIGEHPKEKKKVELLLLFCKSGHLYASQVEAKYTPKFKNWIIGK